MSREEQAVIDDLRARRDSGRLSSDLEARLRDLRADPPPADTRTLRRPRTRWAAVIGVAASVAALAVASTILIRTDRAGVAAPTITQTERTSAAGSTAADAPRTSRPSNSSRPTPASNTCGGLFQPPAIDTQIETEVAWPAQLYTYRKSTISFTMRNQTNSRLRGSVTTRVVLTDGADRIVAVLTDPTLAIHAVDVGPDGSSEQQVSIGAGRCPAGNPEPLASGNYAATLMVTVSGSLTAVSKPVLLTVVGR